MNELSRVARIAIPVIIVVGVVVFWWWYCPATTVIVTRHAEKVDPSPLPDHQVPLNPAGEIRADTLAQVLARAGVTRIFVTEKLRTQQTAEPLAIQLGISAVTIPAADVDALIDEVHSWGNRGRVILIVGHSDTVPVIVDRLGGGTVAVGDQFDNLYVLTLRGWRPTRIIQATYGEPR